eukprot:GHVN01082034.1.p1 GENE.GHVN01082034.1~~GHVN01082034.1.p1  ORF type:complete len:765 (+),score=221.12 GHVN01082034.1:590-2884(+)
MGEESAPQPSSFKKSGTADTQSDAETTRSVAGETVPRSPDANDEKTEAPAEQASEEATPIEESEGEAAAEEEGEVVRVTRTSDKADASLDDKEVAADGEGENEARISSLTTEGSQQEPVGMEEKEEEEAGETEETPEGENEGKNEVVRVSRACDKADEAHGSAEATEFEEPEEESETRYDLGECEGEGSSFDDKDVAVDGEGVSEEEEETSSLTTEGFQQEPVRMEAEKEGEEAGETKETPEGENEGKNEVVRVSQADDHFEEGITEAQKETSETKQREGASTTASVSSKGESKGASEGETNSPTTELAADADEGDGDETTDAPDATSPETASPPIPQRSTSDEPESTESELLTEPIEAQGAEGEENEGCGFEQTEPTPTAEAISPPIPELYANEQPERSEATGVTEAPQELEKTEVTVTPQDTGDTDVTEAPQTADLPDNALAINPPSEVSALLGEEDEGLEVKAFEAKPQPNIPDEDGDQKRTSASDVRDEDHVMVEPTESPLLPQRPTGDVNPPTEETPTHSSTSPPEKEEELIPITPTPLPSAPAEKPTIEHCSALYKEMRLDDDESAGLARTGFNMLFSILSFEQSELPPNADKIVSASLEGIGTWAKEGLTPDQIIRLCKCALDDKGRTAYHKMVEFGMSGPLELPQGALLLGGAQYNEGDWEAGGYAGFVDNMGNTPLHLAATTGNARIARIVLGHAGTRSQMRLLMMTKNDEGKTALDVAEGLIGSKGHAVILQLKPVFRMFTAEDKIAALRKDRA